LAKTLKDYFLSNAFNWLKGRVDASSNLAEYISYEETLEMS